MISGYLIGDKELLRRLGDLPKSTKLRVDLTVKSLGFELERKVKAEKLSGQVLNVITGRLRASISHGAPNSVSRFESDADRAIYYVGTNVKYGAVHEYGFDGMVPVRPYIRHSYVVDYKLKPMSQRKIASKFDGEIIYSSDSYRRVLGDVTGYAHVNGFLRHMKMPARSYLRSSLEEMRGTITERLSMALKSAAVEGLKP